MKKNTEYKYAIWWWISLVKIVIVRLLTIWELFEWQTELFLSTQDNMCILRLLDHNTQEIKQHSTARSWATRAISVWTSIITCMGLLLEHLESGSCQMEQSTPSPSGNYKITKETSGTRDALLCQDRLEHLWSVLIWYTWYRVTKYSTLLILLLSRCRTTTIQILIRCVCFKIFLTLLYGFFPDFDQRNCRHWISRRYCCRWYYFHIGWRVLS